jgi:hypothetical protein
VHGTPLLEKEKHKKYKQSIKKESEYYYSFKKTAAWEGCFAILSRMQKEFQSYLDLDQKFVAFGVLGEPAKMFSRFAC